MQFDIPNHVVKNVKVSSNEAKSDETSFDLDLRFDGATAEDLVKLLDQQIRIRWQATARKRLAELDPKQPQVVLVEVLAGKSPKDKVAAAEAAVVGMTREARLRLIAKLEALEEAEALAIEADLAE
jgi:hypothetical protein